MAVIWTFGQQALASSMIVGITENIRMSWAGPIPIQTGISYPSSTEHKSKDVLLNGRNCHCAIRVAEIATAPLTAAVTVLCIAQELSADFIPLWPTQLYLFGVPFFTLFACKV